MSFDLEKCRGRDNNPRIIRLRFAFEKSCLRNVAIGIVVISSINLDADFFFFFNR